MHQQSQETSSHFVSFDMESSHPKTRNACDRCHFRKLKCERARIASCGRCTQDGEPCIFSPRRPYNASKRLRLTRQRKSHLTKDVLCSSSLDVGKRSFPRMRCRSS
ncbi:hypothetical protein BDV95DRAFT_84629 [Massariosphaeria phaeospora]|uniref:Zn(2)-C6 fungal-type domain-containing protein n=1 Tax=Massariosphaeria phaeospora TaxID=100035 RepID=A0A7C8I848_9PLEO|nr:hypothetical protein BDV95DRAFT_84629 [Massariosphaeria phaeospora]